MGLEFITRIIRTTAILALVVALYLTMYVAGKTALGFLVGVTWSLVNLYFIKGLVTEVITPRETRKDVAVVLGLIKFPILYVGGFLIIASGYFPVIALLAGFSLIFPVALLKVLGRVILRMDSVPYKKQEAEGAIDT
jgi:hypothetical protein